MAKNGKSGVDISGPRTRNVGGVGGTESRCTLPTQRGSASDARQRVIGSLQGQPAFAHRSYTAPCGRGDSFEPITSLFKGTVIMTVTTSTTASRKRGKAAPFVFP